MENTPGRIDSVDYLNSKIINALDSQEVIQKKKKFSEWKREIVLSSIRGGKENSDLYLKFRTSIREKDYFSLEDVNALGLEYDILLFLSKKGVGKSYYMIQQMNEWIADGKGTFAIFRLTDEDLNSVRQQVNDYEGKFYMDAKGDFYSKYQTQPDIKNPSKQVPRQVGRSSGLLSAAKLKGGGYKNLRGMIMDEATDRRRGIKKEHFDTFFKSILNSIERESHVPFIIFGNTDGYESAHPLFACLGIDPDESLVYIKREFEGAKNPTRILYINSRGGYKKGAQHSKMIGAIADVHQVVSAFVNESISKTRKICSLDLTAVTDPLFGILFRDIERQVFLCKMSSYTTTLIDTDIPITAYFICIESYDPMYTYGFNVFTMDEVLHSLYVEHTHFIDDTADHWDFIRRAVKTNYCFFIGTETEALLSKYLKPLAEDKRRLF